MLVRSLDAANGRRFEVTILVIVILHPAHRIDAGASEKSDVVRGGRKTENRGVARPLYAGQIIRDQRIALAEHADDALLLHLPIVKGKGRPQPARIEGGRLKYGPDRPRGRGFRFEVGVARPSTGGHETLRAIVEGGYSSSAQISLAPDIISSRDRKSTRLNSSH